MGSGKSSWFRQAIAGDNTRNFLYIAYRLKDIEEQKQSIEAEGIIRDISEPQNKGNGKLDNIVNLISQQRDIMSTHELFRRFDGRCYEALKENSYTLVIDEAIEAVRQYSFSGRDDYKYLLNNGDITVDENGKISWTGSDLSTRFDDVRILAQNDALFTVDGKYYLWHYPHRFFDVFDQVYILTYNFNGTLLKYYFDLYNIPYEMKSIGEGQNGYEIIDYVEHPDLAQVRSRIDVYQDAPLLDNISQKHNALSARWFDYAGNRNAIACLRNNMYNYTRNIIGAQSSEVMWTCYERQRGKLKGNGYAKGWLPFNIKGSNEYQGRNCLMYAVNYYMQPEMEKFFTARGISIDKDQVALTELLQWVWRSNIRDKSSDKQVHVYIPSSRMRTLFTNWLTA